MDLLQTETVKTRFQRIDTAIRILNTLDYSDVLLEARLFLSPLYISTALDRNEFVISPKSQALHRDTVGNTLRKNIYYLAAFTKNVKELIVLCIDRELITHEDTVTMDFEDDHLKAVTLFICFIKKSPAQLTLSMLIVLLSTTGNSLVAKILTDALKLIPDTTVSPPPKLEARIEAATMTVGAAAVSTEEWSCQNCTLLNENSTSICVMCFKSRDFLLTSVCSSKVCRNCTYINLPEAKICEICSTETSNIFCFPRDDTVKQVEDSSESSDSSFIYCNDGVNRLY